MASMQIAHISYAVTEQHGRTFMSKAYAHWCRQKLRIVVSSIRKNWIITFMNLGYLISFNCVSFFIEIEVNCIQQCRPGSDAAFLLYHEYALCVYSIYILLWDTAWLDNNDVSIIINISKYKIPKIVISGVETQIKLRNKTVSITPSIFLDLISNLPEKKTTQKGNFKALGPLLKYRKLDGSRCATFLAEKKCK